jgi:hypothetical protein
VENKTPLLRKLSTSEKKIPPLFGAYFSFKGFSPFLKQTLPFVGKFFHFEKKI